MTKPGRMRFFGILFLMIALAAMPLSASAKIRVNKSSLSLDVGESYQLKLKGLTGGEGAAVWKSKDKTVAKVSKTGKVVTRKKGSTCVYAVVDGKRYRCYLTVTQPVTSIELNSTSLSLKKGDTYQLTAKLGPEDADDQRLIWKSYNKKVAKVNSKGKVMAVGAGTAKIVARARGGENMRVICKVTVTQKEDVKLDKTQVSLEVGKSLKLTVTPNTDGSVYAWATSDKSIATVTKDGTVTAVKAGRAAIVALREEDHQKDTCYVTVTEAQTEAQKETEQSAEQNSGETEASADTAEKEPSAKAKEFLAILDKYSNQVKEDKKNGITWSYASKTSMPVYKTWKQNYDNSRKTKNGYASCVQIAQWGLRELGIIGNGNFRGDIGGGFTIVDKEQLLKHCVILTVNKTPNQLLAEGNLLPGDICSHVNIQHTNVYAGDGKWYDSGRGGDGQYADNGNFVFNSFGPVPTGYSMDKEMIGSIVRIIE